MGFDPISLAIGTAAVGAISGGVQASAANRSAKRGYRAEYRSALLQTDEAARQAEVDRLARRQEADRVRALVQVSAAERGIGTGGTVADITNSESYQAALNQYNIDRSQQYTNERIIAGYNSSTASIKSRTQNALLNAILGGAQGFSTGLSIGNNIQSATAPVPKVNTPSEATIERLWVETALP